MAATDNIIGSQARGLAGVFGSSINPLQYLMQQQARQQQRQAAIDADQRKTRDKIMDYNEKYNPSSKFAEFNYRINDMAQKGIRDFTEDGFAKGYSAAQINAERMKRIGVLNAYVAEVDAWKETLDEIEKELKKGETEGIYSKGASSKLRDIYMDAGGKLKADGDIRQGMANIEQIFNDPNIYNKGGVLSKWVKGLPEQSRAVYSKKLDPGYTPEDLEITVKSKLKYEREPDGTLKLNDEGNPVPIIDNNTYELAKLDPHMKLLMEANGGPTEKEQMDWLAKNIPGGADAIAQDRKITRGHKNEFHYYKGQRFTVPIESLEERDSKYTAIAQGNRPDLISAVSDINSGLQTYYGDKDGKPLSKGDNPSTIVFEREGLAERGDPLGGLTQEEFNKASAIERFIILEQAKSQGRAIKKEVYDITTEEGRIAAKIAMSEREDKMHTKSSVGGEYSKYLEVKRKKGEVAGALLLDDL